MLSIVRVMATVQRVTSKGFSSLVESLSLSSLLINNCQSIHPQSTHYINLIDEKNQERKTDYVSIFNSRQ